MGEGKYIERYPHYLCCRPIYINPAHYEGIFLTFGAAWLRCGVAQLVARRLAVRQARVRFPARHHREVFPTEHRSDEEMERGLSEWRRINVLYESDCMNVCMYIIKYEK